MLNAIFMFYAHIQVRISTNAPGNKFPMTIMANIQNEISNTRIASAQHESNCSLLLRNSARSILVGCQCGGNVSCAMPGLLEPPSPRVKDVSLDVAGKLVN